MREKVYRMVEHASLQSVLNKIEEEGRYPSQFLPAGEDPDGNPMVTVVATEEYVQDYIPGTNELEASDDSLS